MACVNVDGKVTHDDGGVVIWKKVAKPGSEVVDKGGGRVCWSVDVNADRVYLKKNKGRERLEVDLVEGVVTTLFVTRVGSMSKLKAAIR